ncbi:4167_t:CDS:2, partial [Paraglomus brasilianum]
AGPKRFLDIQFRLLREDMLRPLRDGLYNFVAGLSDNEQQMAKLINKSGRFKYDKGKINGDLNVYSNVRFKNIKVDKNRGFSVRVGFKPPKAGKSNKQRKIYWERSKKLLNGSLICVLWAPNLDEDKSVKNSTNGYTLYFGVITDRQENSLAANENEATIGVHFMDTSIYPIVLEDINRTPDVRSKTPDRFMVESTGVYFESYVHILKALQDLNPGALPFSRHLAPVTEEDLSADIEPPLYARAPGFRFDLSILLGKNENFMLDPTDELSQDRAIKKLTEANVLDRSQAEALVCSLCREVALIEGPPGTGKTYVGVELMKVLLDSKNRKRAAIGPVLTICFTNHALDQFLEHLLHAGIKKIVRLGSRSKSEEIKPFALEEQCRNQGKTVEQSRMLRAAYKELDRLSAEAKELTGQLSRKTINWNATALFLLTNYPSIYEQLCEDHADANNEEDEFEGEWETVSGGRGHEDRFSQWVHGSDLKQIMNDLRNKEKGKQKQREPQLLSTHNQYDYLQDMEEMQDQETKLIYGEDANQEIHKDLMPAERINEEDANQEIHKDLMPAERINEEDANQEIHKDLMPAERINDDGIQVWKQQDLEIPKTDRDLEILLQEQNVWKMSMNERIKLHNHWRELIHKDVIQRLADLEKKYTEKRKEIDDIRDGVRKKILSSTHVIGMTTNGAAKFQSLIRSVGPRIIVCEEAGEVLEAHILAPLKETQHLILIGDHLQLRPHITTYELSLDSNVGKKFALDRSMFERLVNDKKPMVQLLTQRRMRSEIADLVRETLYPNLIDHACTAAYPRVRGTTHNLFLFDHKNPEDAAGSNQFAVQSHSSSFEVKMVVEMVKYFVRNGYDKNGDVAVLTPYLGQMIQIRDALSQQFVVVIDERDGEQIAMMTEDNESKEDESSSVSIAVASNKSLAKQVTLRTIDNFQGEEATIVIISLVRNVNQANGSGSIGFLKSENRTNVLLSRAKHGMFLLGNANLLAERAQQDKTTMWPTVIDILREKGQLGNAFPLQCNRHPNTLSFVERPEQFSEFAPDGGCQEPCGFTLKCGHVCQYKCHSDDPDHLGIKCGKPCQRLHEPCQHTCPKLCGDTCGNCVMTINNVGLPCGHVKNKAPCYQTHDPTEIKCNELIDCILPRCGHEQKRHCFEATKDVLCTQQCGILLPCGHFCLSNCEDCQRRSIRASSAEEALLDGESHVIRSSHAPCKQMCERNLYCEHRCEIKNALNHAMSVQNHAIGSANIRKS